MKKVLKNIFITAAALLSLTSCTIRQLPSDTRTVSVQGSGQVELKADTASIKLAVNTRNADVVAASEENSTRINNVIASLNEIGIPKYDITTANYYIRQDSPTVSGTRTISGQYSVSNEIIIKIKDIDKAGTVIDTAIKSGANSLTSISYSVSDTEEAVRQARMLAIKQAEENASLLASSNGAALGQIISINEYSGSDYPRARSYEDNSEAALMTASTPIYSGKVTVTVTIDATWELKQSKQNTGLKY